MKRILNDIRTAIQNCEIVNENDNIYISKFFMSKLNISRIIEFVENENFNVKEIFTIFESLLEKIADDTMPENPINHFYDFALEKAFPDVMEEKVNEKYNKVTIVYLEILRCFIKYEKNNDIDTWQSKYGIKFLSRKEISEIEDPTEYLKFMKYYKNEYVEEMMKLNQEISGYTTFDHICGVHYLSLNVARQLKKAGIKVDLGRVSGAAAGHDIGKYGCKKNEQHRVAYFHYYYTGEWFRNRNIVYIRNVAINHSTWDLELENLSIESLILIFADFRVKASRDKDGNEIMKFYTLDEAFNVILNKLDNVDEKKENRYRKVYSKLKDFENYLLDFSINIEPNEKDNKVIQIEKKLYPIMNGEEIIENTIFLSIKHNIELMNRLRDEASLSKLLEEVRNTRDANVIRGYVEVFDEYFTYLTQKQKIIIIEFLFRNLISKEEDIRELCGKLIGKLISTYDEKLRKELPEQALREQADYTTLELFEKFVEKALNPPESIIEKHRELISYSLREIVLGYFENLPDEKMSDSINILLKYFNDERMNEKWEFYLLKLTRILRYEKFSRKQREEIIKFIMELVFSSDKKLKLRALNTLFEIYPYLEEDEFELFHLRQLVEEGIFDKKDPAENFAWFKLSERISVEDKILDKYRKICLDDLKYTSDIFLSNLKTATYAISKRFQIELLLRNTILHDYSNTFYMAQHLCNLLKVSAFENVRNTAGKGLISIFPHLSFEQKNDIVVELIRSLEMESYEFTKYIPEYLGRLLLHLKPIEFDEIVDHFYSQLATNNVKLIALFQKTAGVSISRYSKYKLVYKENSFKHKKRLERLIGIILSGFSHDESFDTQIALNVIGIDIFKSEILTLNEKKEIFDIVIKKLITLITEIEETNDLLFINNSSALKEIYNFISEYRFLYKKLDINEYKKVAIFPGAFDPFSRSHRTIALEIRNMGFEVQLAIDEFSWSKKTQPNIIRRNIVRRSIAKELGIFILPKEISINIANSEDVLKVKKDFKDTVVYLAVGSDVLIHASAYNNSKSEITNLPHVVFERPHMMSEVDHKKLKDVIGRLPEETIRIELGREYEHISSTQIRNYIDTNRDISDLVDPFAEKYIYDNRLYKKEPQFKNIVTTKSIKVEIVEEFSETLLMEISKIYDIASDAMYEKFEKVSMKKHFRLLIIRDIKKNGEIIGLSGFHTIKSSEITTEFNSEMVMNYVIENSVGRIIIIDFIFKNQFSDYKDSLQMTLAETLSYVIEKDYSYCIYIDKIRKNINKEIKRVLNNHGFIEVENNDEENIPYVVNMTAPIVLNLDIESMFKDEFKNNENMLLVLKKTRRRLQKAITSLYRGKLLMNYSRTMLHENLIKEICEVNNVSTVPSETRNYGKAMCIPFGAIFKQGIIPNTVTKTLHVEKYFNEDLSFHEIKASPYYMSIENQIKMIKSFNRPVILVDDLLNKGYRIKVLEPLLKKHDIKVEKLIVGIMSGKGKALTEKKDYDVASAYFLPNIKVWFYESKLYPFIGGDGAWKEKEPLRNFIESINMIMPYTNPHYIEDIDKDGIIAISEVALRNALDIMRVAEFEYQNTHNRMLTLERLGEVLISPRIPDKGNNISYDMYVKPSDYILEDINLLNRLR